MSHPTEEKLALFSGGDLSGAAAFFVRRHVKDCAACAATVERYEAMRHSLQDSPEPDVEWNLLAAEMKANIHLGLAAGECVRGFEAPRRMQPRLIAAFACLLLLATAGVVLRNQNGFGVAGQNTAATAKAPADAMLRSSDAGIEFQSGGSSLMLLGKGAAGQTVSAEGEIRASYIDGETGSVTINHVYLQ